MTINDNKEVVRVGTIASAMESRALPRCMCPQTRKGQLDCQNCLFSSNCELYARTVKAKQGKKQW